MFVRSFVYSHHRVALEAGLGVEEFQPEVLHDGLEQVQHVQRDRIIPVSDCSK